MKNVKRITVNLIESLIYYGGCFVIATVGFSIATQNALGCAGWLCVGAHFIPAMVLITLFFVGWAWLVIVAFGKIRDKLQLVG